MIRLYVDLEGQLVACICTATSAVPRQAPLPASSVTHKARLPTLDLPCLTLGPYLLRHECSLLPPGQAMLTAAATVRVCR